MAFHRGPGLEPRELTDPRTMRAIAHPLRIALLELLAIEGPLTATEAGERLGESPANCSFHLRQLAKYGFVEESRGGRGRHRPWRLTGVGMRFSDREFLLFVTPEELQAIDKEIEAVLRRHVDRVTDPSLRPPGSLPIEVLVFAFPFQRPETT